MTRFAVLATAALAATIVSAAPAPAPGPHEVHNLQGFNWEGAISSWFSVRPGVRTFSYSYAHTHSHHHGHHKWHTRTRTATVPATTQTATSSVVEATSSVVEAASSVVEATSSVVEATSSVAEATSSVVETTSVAPEPTVEPTTSAIETSSLPQATSTVAPTTIAPTTTATPKTTSVRPTTTTSANPTTTSAAAGTGNANIDAYLKGHNDIRAQHGAVALTWADDLAAAAAKWAGNCVWQHSQGKVGSFGENLAAGTGLTAAAAVKMWTDESVDYDPANPQYSHFTQVVWKGTTEVGCAVTSCTGLLTGYAGAVQYHVCEYRAPGNVIGQFDKNVQA